MREIELVVANRTGLHARPAREFVNIAKQFRSDIRVSHGAKTANAKSMISILTLGVERGGTIRIQVAGDDEETALEALKAAVLGGLGEGVAQEQDLAPAPTTTPPRLPGQAAATTGRHTLQGIGAAPGIAIGPVHQLRKARIVVEDDVSAGSSEEQARLQRAIECARAQLAALHEQMLARSGASEAAIFEVHLEILDDPDLLDAVLARLDDNQSAARAWQGAIDARAGLVAGLDDPLLAARSADIHDVGYRVLRLLVGAGEEAMVWPDHPVVIVADDPSPSDTASFDRERVLGLCTAGGGPTTHAAIIARALGLPAVVGAGQGVLGLANGTTVILEGDSGLLRVDPDAETLARAREAQERRRVSQAVAAEAAAQPAVTQDGHRVEVVANIGGVGDAAQAQAAGAEGVGLLRTEFLFLDRQSPPGEQEQFEVYRDIALAMGGRAVIVRTLDIGGDKPLPYISLPPEQNPFLGERGIRLALARPQLLREQLRAILRAAGSGRLRIMFPMVSDISEWRAARAMAEEVRAELGAPEVDLGIMIEVPAAALMADAFAAEVDFFSIGTNDLTQYTLAMDRTHPTLAGRADGLHPAVLRLIERTVQAAHAAGKWVGVCGELGADPLAIPILIGIGVDELSVNVPAVATTKAAVRALTLARARELAAQALACSTAVQVREKASVPQ